MTHTNTNYANGENLHFTVGIPAACN